MKIQWLGHSCFLLVASDGTKIIMDPYESNAFGGGLKYERIKIAPDIVTVSHSHADHGYVEGLPNHFEVVSDVGEKQIRGISIKGIKSYHDKERGTVRGNNIIFVVEVDGIRVCHLGDLGHVLSADQVNEIGAVDILLIPVGGYYTIGPEEASAVVDQLNPKVVIPMHFKTPKVEFPIVGVDEFLRGKQNVRRFDSSEFEITKDTLPAERQIVVLKYAL
ncbi:MAG: MBL fold metallo-hydrolase [Armatimonadota bacterium]|nr:MBL fold metallo-hydrolase [Armatimonadota bacterium]